MKDVRSSDGTFFKGELLYFTLGISFLAVYQEFGIDIVGEEDSKTITHHKVATGVVCVFNEQDAQVAARAGQRHHLQQQQFPQQQAAPGAPSLLSTVGTSSGSSIIGGAADSPSLLQPSGEPARPAGIGWNGSPSPNKNPSMTRPESTEISFSSET